MIKKRRKILSLKVLFENTFKTTTFYKVFLKICFEMATRVPPKCVVSLQVYPKTPEPVLSWNGKRGKCERTMRRQQKKCKYVRAMY